MEKIFYIGDEKTLENICSNCRMCELMCSITNCNQVNPSRSRIRLIHMNIEEAIKTAIEYEIRIRDVYREASAAVDDDAGKRIFDTLGDDEQRHIDYLEYKLDRKKGLIKLRLPVKPSMKVPRIKLGKSARIKAQLVIEGNKKQQIQPGNRVAIRQLYDDMEVGRVTWQFHNRKTQQCEV